MVRMLGPRTAALSHPLPQPSEPPAPVSSSGRGRAFLFSAQPSPALSVDSSGSSTIRGTSEGRKHNRWSGSASSLSRSNSDSSTLSKVRPSHAHSVSVPHIVTTRPGTRTKTSPSPAIESSNARVNGDRTLVAAQHIPPPPIQPSRPPPPPPPEKAEAQHWQLPAQRKTKQHRSSSQRAMLSSALQKANTAVLLDNAGNIEGAMEAYTGACTLLQQAMSRAELEGDRAQLQSIVRIFTESLIDDTPLLHHPGMNMLTYI